MVETRRTAAERREEILEAAMSEFAARGLHGASTEEIARRAGLSQPYLFRLFGTKKELFLASVVRCMRLTLEVFQRAAEGKRGEEALEAMGRAYVDELLADREKLMLQMQAYAAADDDDVRQAIRSGYGDLFTYVERVSGEPPARVSTFFAKGKLLNVIAAMDLQNSGEDWASRLVQGCLDA